MATKRFWSYEQIQALIRHAVVDRDVFKDFQPSLILCIAAGGFVPTRILRSCLKHKLGYNLPIQTIGLQLYDIEGCDPTTSPVQRVQWLSYGTGPGQLLLQGHKILVVDEVDDSRKTLSCAVTELLSDIRQEQQQHLHERPDQPWVQPELGVFVVHNKQRPKLAQLPEDILRDRYFTALDIEDCWCVYPWDAEDIYQHTQTAEAAAAATPLLNPVSDGELQKGAGHRAASALADAAYNGHTTNGHAAESRPQTLLATSAAAKHGCPA